MMGLFDSLFGDKKMQCPSCGAEGATRKGESILCPNPSCPYFDASLGQKATPLPAGATFAQRGDFSPARPLTIQYKNFQGVDRTFTADASTAYRRKNHIVAEVAPTGQKISLSRDRIQNLRTVEEALPPRVEPGQDWPTPKERQVLAYHKRHKTTSPLYEKARAKYPNW
jgi:hypothetical protein